MVLSPATFGIPDSAAAVQLSFITVAVWWLVFSIPLFRNVPEPPRTADTSSAVATGLRSLAKTIREHRTHRMAVLFLVAYFFYIDGVHTIIRMAVDYGLSLGFPDDSLIVALLIVQFVGFPAALVYGFVARRVGPKPTLYFGVVVYVAVTIYAYFMTSVVEFYILAVVIGLVQGGVQAVSRSLYARFVPAAPERRVLRVLQHAGPVRGDHRAVPGGDHGTPHRKLPARNPVRDRGARDRGGAPRLRPEQEEAAPAAA